LVFIILVVYLVFFYDKGPFLVKMAFELHVLINLVDSIDVVSVAVEVDSLDLLHEIRWTLILVSVPEF